MSAVAGYNAGSALHAAGIVPENCYYFAVSVHASGAVKIETHCYATGEQWEKILAIVEQAKKLGCVDRGLAIVSNYELSESLKMHTVETPQKVKP